MFYSTPIFSLSPIPRDATHDVDRPGAYYPIERPIEYTNKFTKLWLSGPIGRNIDRFLHFRYSHYVTARCKRDLLSWEPSLEVANRPRTDRETGLVRLADMTQHLRP